MHSRHKHVRIVVQAQNTGHGKKQMEYMAHCTLLQMHTASLVQSWQPWYVSNADMCNCLSVLKTFTMEKSCRVSSIYLNSFKMLTFLASALFPDIQMTGRYIYNPSNQKNGSSKVSQNRPQGCSPTTIRCYNTVIDKYNTINKCVKSTKGKKDGNGRTNNWNTSDKE